MYEVRRIFDNPYAVDGPLIIRTDDLAEAHQASDRAIAEWRVRKAQAGTQADGEKFVLVLLDWSSLRPGEECVDAHPLSSFGRDWQIPS